jgi:hypothetical protein
VSVQVKQAHQATGVHTIGSASATGMECSATSLLREHGIDPALLIAVDLDKITSRTSHELNKANTANPHVAEGPLRYHVTRGPTQAASNNSPTPVAVAARPTSVNFPTNVYYQSVMDHAEEVLSCREVLAVKPKEQLVAAGDARLKPDAQVEAEVRHLLTSRSYHPLPVLQELDRDLSIQHVALQRHARYKEQCEQGRLFTATHSSTTEVPRIC